MQTHVSASPQDSLNNNVLDEKFDWLIDDYIEHQVGELPNFLSTELTEALRKNLEALNAKEELSPAGTGRGISRLYDMQIRSDKIYWIDNTSNDKHELEFLNIVTQFISRLNQSCYTGINDYEFHYALYDAGSFYKRHIDQFKKNPGRKYTFIIYLNDNWEESNGGFLATYPNEETRLITPTGGKCVFFKSDELEHEVMPANRARMSITGWLKRN